MYEARGNKSQDEITSGPNRSLKDYLVFLTEDKRDLRGKVEETSIFCDRCFKTGYTIRLKWVIAPFYRQSKQTFLRVIEISAFCT